MARETLYRSIGHADEQGILAGNCLYNSREFHATQQGSQQGILVLRFGQDAMSYSIIDNIRGLDDPDGFAQKTVIPGPPAGWNPESRNTGLWNMGSGFAAPLGARLRAPVGWRIFDAPGRPGMTSILCKAIWIIEDTNIIYD